MPGEKSIPVRHSWRLLILVAIPLLGLIVIPPFVLLSRVSPGTFLKYLEYPGGHSGDCSELVDQRGEFADHDVFRNAAGLHPGPREVLRQRRIGGSDRLADRAAAGSGGNRIADDPGPSRVDRRLAGSGGYPDPVYADRGDHRADICLVSVLHQSGVGRIFVDRAGNSGRGRAGRGVADSAIPERDDSAGVSQSDGGRGADLVARLGEFGATIIFAGNLPGKTQTMPLAVYIGFEIDMRQALTLAAILLIISFGLLMGIRAGYSKM